MVYAVVLYWIVRRQFNVTNVRCGFTMNVLTSQKPCMKLCKFQTVPGFARNATSSILMILSLTTSLTWKIKIDLVFFKCYTQRQLRLGLLLFSLYIKGITSDIESEIRLFADDCVCYRENKDEGDTVKFQRNIDRLGCWAKKWGNNYVISTCQMQHDAAD